ncbi:hypothetical protein DPEC_G00217040 [Dallia pectoralis]|uniref:Uncharacterized protein n=1 Tax=Dallia pectoralis TaxID=75939 RepID=A0ACC2G348_DALPE|nr:hypothetical protein DPEC_G00217040 [Dallia pectoralis]
MHAFALISHCMHVFDHGERGDDTFLFFKCSRNLNALSFSGKMSNVRLSNGSPTLERTDARLSDRPKPTACRSLFGSADHEELKRDLKGHLREMEEAASAKWNFDFSNHTPLSNGKYEWQQVDSKDIPVFYNAVQQSAKGTCPPGNNNVDLNGNRNSSCCVLSPSENTERSETQMESKECNGQRKRPACHDSLSQNKRSHSSSDEVTCCLTSVEQTPRKTSPRTQT